jgi:hypothetical protein
MTGTFNPNSEISFSCSLGYLDRRTGVRPTLLPEQASAISVLMTKHDPPITKTMDTDLVWRLRISRRIDNFRLVTMPKLHNIMCETLTQ